MSEPNAVVQPSFTPLFDSIPDGWYVASLEDVRTPLVCLGGKYAHVHWKCDLQWADGGGRLCSGTGPTPGAAHAAAIQEIRRRHPHTLEPFPRIQLPTWAEADAGILEAARARLGEPMLCHTTETGRVPRNPPATPMTRTERLADAILKNLTAAYPKIPASTFNSYRPETVDLLSRGAHL